MAAATHSVQNGTTDVGEGKVAASSALTAAPSTKLTGGAAILAKLRAQKTAQAASEAASVSRPGVAILYASQLGTAAEIAKNIHAEAESRGIKSCLASMNDFTFDAVRPSTTHVVIMVASSTGDGDAPDNGAKFYATARRRTHPENLLKGVQFTCLGLGDSNYTRFMAIPRALRTRFTELGAETFYDPGEADEVDGLEEVVDKWLDGLWPSLAETLKTLTTNTLAVAPAATTSEMGSDENKMHGVPPLAPVEIKLQWLEGKEAAAVRAQEASASPPSEELTRRDPEGGGMYSAETPFWASIVEARHLTAPTAGDREVVHLALDISDSGITYSPGDAIGVLPQNSPALVDAIIARLGLEADAVFKVLAADAGNSSASAVSNARPSLLPGSGSLLHHVHWPCTVRAALLRGFDLTSPPRKSLLRTLAHHCNEMSEKERLLYLCSRDGRGAYATDILNARPTLLDLLNTFPSCCPPVDALFDALPALPPRMYSLTCAQNVCPDRVEVAFTVVRYTTAVRSGSEEEREGVATSWLRRICAAALNSPLNDSPVVGQYIPIFMRRGGDFRPPTDLSVPWILIGPGTGVAPFRAFLQERRRRLQAVTVEEDPLESASACGPCWLYFGCRRADQDFLYETDFRDFEADGTLTKLCVAFSRAQDHKVYVQHLMAASGRELHDLIIDHDGYVFVCGDGAGMAKDVHSALIDIMVKHGEATQAEAAATLMEMAKRGRYVRDIWS